MAARSRMDENERPVLSEFTIAILSMLCLSMGIGSSLPQDLGLLIAAAGAIGMVAYAIAVRRVRAERNMEAEQGKRRVEARLINHASGFWYNCTDSVTSLFDSIRGR